MNVSLSNVKSKLDNNVYWYISCFRWSPWIKVGSVHKRKVHSLNHFFRGFFLSNSIMIQWRIAPLSFTKYLEKDFSELLAISMINAEIQKSNTLRLLELMRSTCIKMWCLYWINSRNVCSLSDNSSRENLSCTFINLPFVPTFYVASRYGLLPLLSISRFIKKFNDVSMMESSLTWYLIFSHFLTDAM